MGRPTGLLNPLQGDYYHGRRTASWRNASSLFRAANNLRQALLRKLRAQLDTTATFLRVTVTVNRQI